jgi:hypothetical protein
MQGDLQAVALPTSLMPVSTLEKVLDYLRHDRERLFGSQDVRFAVVHAAEREVSHVLTVAVRGSEGPDTIFVKLFKPTGSGSSNPEAVRARVLHDFHVTSRAHTALAASSRYAAVRPLACFPDQLAIVTAKAPGLTLLELLETRAAWWPFSTAVQRLEGVLAGVGGWLRAFQSVEPCHGRFSLEQMREYIEVRLRRLRGTTPPALDNDGRERVLSYFDRTAASVASADLQEVLTHGDLALSNVLVGEREITVIDFAMATPGSVFMDIARLHTQLEFLLAKPKFRPWIIQRLQQSLLNGFDPELGPERPLFRLFVLQHLLCHMSNIARNPAPPLAHLYNRYQLRLRQRWLRTLTT